MATTSKSQAYAIIRVLIPAGFVFTLATMYVSINYVPINVPDVTSVADKMAFAIRWLLLSLLPMYMGVTIVALTRLSNIEAAGVDPGKPISDKIVGLRQRALQNTLEQTLIHIHVVLAVSTFLEGASLKLVPISVFLFLCGRLMFYIGYLGTDNTLHRAFGFSSTVTNNITVLIYGLYCLYTSGAGYGLA